MQQLYEYLIQNVLSNIYQIQSDCNSLPILSCSFLETYAAVMQD